MEPYLQLGWTWLVRIFVGLGGFAGMTKVFEWLFSGPKIVGEVEQQITASVTSQQTGKHVGAMTLMQLYVVNKRVQPVTIRNTIISAKLNGKWVVGGMVAIPDNFVVAPYKIDFAQSRFYEIAWRQLLEYGKGVRGWLYITFEGEVTGDDLSRAQYKVVLNDAFGKKHTIHYQRAKDAPPGVLQYFPDAGIKPSA